MGLIERITNKEIKLFPIENGYRFYGKTFEVREELKSIGVVWNKEKENFEISNDNFSKLNVDLREYIIKTILQSRMESLKVISEAIINETIKLYPKNEVYKVYGKTKEINRHLLNTSFKFVEKNYQINIETFNKEFSDEVKTKVASLQNENGQSPFQEIGEQGEF